MQLLLAKRQLAYLNGNLDNDVSKSVLEHFHHGNQKTPKNREEPNKKRPKDDHSQEGLSNRRISRIRAIQRNAAE